VAVTLLLVDRFAPGERVPRNASTLPANAGVRPVIASVVNLPEYARIAFASDPGGVVETKIALSPDGRWLAYIGEGESGGRLYVRALGTFAAPQAISGTEGAIFVFFSPDSQSIGFLTRSQLKRVPLKGEGVHTIANVAAPLHAYWIEDDWIYVGELGASRLLRVRASGDDREVVAERSTYIISDVFAKGRSALANSFSLNMDYAEILLIDLQSGSSKPTGLEGYNARWAPTGHLLFARNGNILAVAFDPDSGSFKGEPVAVLHGVAMDSMYSDVQLDLSDSGTLAYVPGPDLGIGRIVSVEREGGIRALTAQPQRYRVFDLSADDMQVAVTIADVRDYVWLYDMVRGEGKKLAGTDDYGWPVFSQFGGLGVSGRGVSRLGIPDSAIMVRTGDGQRWRSVMSKGRLIRATDWSPDGEYLAVERIVPSAIGLLPVNEEAQPQWFGGDSYVWGAVFSPDGRWLAYASDETGREEIWVRSLDDPDLRRQLSVNAGVEPVWCPCGRIFFRAANQFYSAGVEAAGDLQFDAIRHDFTVPGFLDTPGRSYDVSSDGETLYTVQRAELPSDDKIHVLANWFDELERLAAPE
jgi:WD40 repeat protein